MKSLVKKSILFPLIALLLSCADGDLQIEPIDFETVEPQFCGTVDTDTELLFKIEGTEALILELQSGLLRNEVSEDTLQSPIPDQSQLFLRIFSENVNASYFCDVVPPLTPTVVEEITAATGTLLVYTTRNPADTTLFEHQISFQGVSFVNSAGERFTNLTVENFGTLQTSAD